MGCEQTEPATLAVELLAETPMPEWPAVAQTWLQHGHYSQPLIDFATLTPAEAHVLADEMLNVLRSPGLSVSAREDIGSHLPEISGFAPRCRKAVLPIAADLRHTWKPYSLRPLAVTNDSPVFVQVLIGDALHASSDPMTASMNDDELVAVAATQVSEALLEEAGYQWPSCAQHASRLLVRDQTSASSAPTSSSWWCPSADHVVATLGQLLAAEAIATRLWWADDLDWELEPQ